MREPLLHFLILGALMVAAVGLSGTLSSDAADRQIVVGPEKIRRIATTYARQYGTPPNPKQLRALVDRYVEEEISYREGLAQGLSRDDEIIRRRIVQKFQFLQQDLKVPAEPTKEELQSFFERHQPKYAIPEKVSFRHIYFSPDIGGDANAQTRAGEVLRPLALQNLTGAQQFGDRFHGLHDYASLDQVELGRLFGDSEFSRKLFLAPAERWAGPFRSGYGWHLVYVSVHEPQRIRPFAEVREQVRSDYLDEARAAKNRAAFEELARRYVIVREDVADAR